MATTLAQGLQKAQQKVQDVSSKDKKVVDLEPDTVNVHTDQPMTTDHGVRISNTDNWLRAVDNQHSGPSMLEDQIAREKVHHEHLYFIVQIN
jgi:catalase